MSSAGTTGGCVFCGATPATNEHIFRDTLRQYAAQPAGIETVLYDGSIRRLHGQSMFDRTVRAACASCNAGWMNHLDLEVESVIVSMIKGESLELSRSTNRRLAFWAAVRAAVRIQGENRQRRAMLAAFPREVFRIRRAPDLCGVWVGTSEVPLGLDAIAIDGVDQAPKIGDDGDGVDSENDPTFLHAFQHVAAVGSLLFVTAGATTGPPQAADVAAALIADLHHAYSKSPIPLTRLWPRPQPTSWPRLPAVPEWVLHEEIVPLLHRAFPK